MDVRWSFFFIFSWYLLERTLTLKQQGVCYFPERWEGTWFQSGVRQSITIEGMRISTKGRCLGSDGDKFLLVDDKRACYRCVVIHEKHGNVLQYKETFCQGRESLPTLCTLITGDALLYSMFRVNAPSEICPFHGAFTFTYDRGHGECKSPVSSIDTCTEESRLLLTYQACPDIYGSESTVEELQCLAVWKEGSSRYLVGKVHHNHATSNEDRFRCFVYEKASPASESIDGIQYRVAQSGDATCNGLSSASEGSRTMTFRKAATLSRCRFPTWISNSIHWHTLDYSATYSFHHRNSTLRISHTTPVATFDAAAGVAGALTAGTSLKQPGADMKMVCAQLKYASRDESSIMLLTHFTTGCQSGFTCMAFYRRDNHVMEVQTGAHTKRMDDACSALYFNPTILPYVTLVTTNPESRQCPYLGKFIVSEIIRNEDRHARSISTFPRHTMPSATSPQNHNELRQRLTNTVDNPILSRYYTREQTIRHLDLMLAPAIIPYITGTIFRRNKRVDSPQPESESGGLITTDCNSPGFSNLVIGCNSPDVMEFRTECTPPDLISSYSCHGKWEENGTHYLITTPLSRSSHGARRYCFIYKESPPDTVIFSTVANNCDRSIKPGITGQLVFNITTVGKCIEKSASNKFSNYDKLYRIVVIAYIIIFIYRNFSNER